MFWHSCVQSLDAKKHTTFGDFATDYCRPLTSCFAKAHRVADVFDRYDVKKLHQIGFTISGFPNEPAM
jgi:hypothetical protein